MKIRRKFFVVEQGRGNYLFLEKTLKGKGEMKIYIQKSAIYLSKESIIGTDH